MILKTALKSQPLHSEGQNGCENNTNILNQTNVSGAVMMASSTVTSWMLETSSAVWISRLYMGCLVSLPFLFRSTACNVDEV